MTNTFVLYHKDCLDGIMAAACAYHCYGDDATYIAADYNDDLLAANMIQLSKDSIIDLVILDFSFNPESMHLLMSQCRQVVWIDHHASAIDAWHAYILKTNINLDTFFGVNIILDYERSGAWLSWEHYCRAYEGQEPPTPIKFTDDYDRWVFKFNGDSKTFAKGAYFVGNFYPNRIYNCFLNPHFSPNESQRHFQEIMKLGKIVRRSDEAYVAQMVNENLMQCIIENQGEVVCGYAINLPRRYASEAGNLVCDGNNTFAMVWWLDKDGTVCSSIRSGGNVFCNRIASWFGGGGHNYSSGFSFHSRQMKVVEKDAEGTPVLVVSSDVDREVNASLIIGNVLDGRLSYSCAKAE